MCYKNYYFFDFLKNHLKGFPGTSGKEHACQCRRHKWLGFDPWVGKIPWRKAWQPTPAFLPGESHGQRSLTGCAPWGSQRAGHNRATEHTHTTAASWWALQGFRSSRSFSFLIIKWEWSLTFLVKIKDDARISWMLSAFLVSGCRWRQFIPRIRASRLPRWLSSKESTY